MVDFLHNKAVARLGVGAHGRKKANGLIDEVETTGLLQGHPAPARLKLTDLFERLEFTHGHNVLLYNGLMRLGGLGWRGIRPYAGIGAGIAVPHVEVIFTGEKEKPWTNEYQFAGPAAQAVAGLEFRTGRVSYFLEYKLSWASISAAITGGLGILEADRACGLPAEMDGRGAGGLMGAAWRSLAAEYALANG